MVLTHKGNVIIISSSETLLQSMNAQIFFCYFSLITVRFIQVSFPKDEKGNGNFIVLNFQRREVYKQNLQKVSKNLFSFSNCISRHGTHDCPRGKEFGQTVIVFDSCNYMLGWIRRP